MKNNRKEPMTEITNPIIALLALILSTVFMFLASLFPLLITGFCILFFTPVGWVILLILLLKK